MFDTRTLIRGLLLLSFVVISATVCFAYDCAGCPTPTFNESTIYSIAAGDVGLPVVADFNNDAKLDIAFNLQGDNGGYTSIIVQLGNGAGGFSSPIITAGSPDNSAEGIAGGDINKDGNIDIVVGNFTGISIAYGDGTGNFATPIYAGTQTGPGLGDPTFFGALAVADLDNDGNPDVVSDNRRECCQGYVWWGNGTGVAYYATMLGDGTAWYDEARPLQVMGIGDFDGDGLLDLLLPTMENLSILLNDSHRNFLGVYDRVGGRYLDSVAVADFNNDGNADFVTTRGSLDLYLNLGGAYFEYHPVNSSCGCVMYSDIEATDLNGDGNPDLIRGAGTVSYLLGDGTGQFGPEQTFSPEGHLLAVGDFNNDGKPDIVASNSWGGWHPPQDPWSSSKLTVMMNTTYQTPVGSNVTTTVANTNFEFDNVTSGGTTSVVPIDAATVGDVPGGFAVADLAFEVHTTATFTGEVTSCFSVTTVNDETDFNGLRVLHLEGTSLVDRTSSHDFANRKICATTTSFSPFYLATVGKKARSLFDRSRAFRTGSTVPVKVQLLDGSDVIISSVNMPLTVRGLRRIGSSTAAEVENAGNSNPDYVFRYDSGLHGYMYNLRTNGLGSGKYVLSFYAGSDQTFLYTVTFEVR